MGWHEYHRRRAALDQVVADGLTVPEGFTDEDEVLPALHHRWSLRLAGRLELATHAAQRDPELDLLDAVGEAWLATVDDNPGLRRLLDEHAGHPALRPAVRYQQAAIARAAGLTEPTDGPAEQAAIGAAFLVLLATGPRDTRVQTLLRTI
jgi:hypothetical protein